MGDTLHTVPADVHLKVIPKGNSQGKLPSRLLRDGPHTVAREIVEDANLGDKTVVDHVYLQAQKAQTPQDFILVHHRTPPVIETKTEFGAVHFESGISGLDGENKGKLAQLAGDVTGYLKTHPGTILRIAGHTDATGDDKSNDRLSAQRAQNTMKDLLPLLPMELRERVVVNAQGFGEKHLAVDTQDASMTNRRVELTAVSDYREPYATVLHVPAESYAALQKNTMRIDMGKGEDTKKIYGSASFEEPRTTLVLERPKSGALAEGPLNLSVVVEDPAHFRVLLRAQNKESIPSVRPTKDGVALFVGDTPVANIALTDPDGRPSSKNLVVGIVNEQGEVTLAKELGNLDQALDKATKLVQGQGGKVNPAAYTPQFSTQKSAAIALH